MDNFVKLTGKIITHEVGHLLGLNHGDAVGPIGFGGHLPFNPAFGDPLTTGPASAFETLDHLIGSPASLGSDRFNDLGALYFGEREVIKLSLAFADPSQTSTVEIGGTTSSSPQVLSLATVSVPNALRPDAFNSVKQFNIGTRIVDGVIGLDPATQRSRSDFYSLSLSRGQLLNVEALSTVFYTGGDFLSLTANTTLTLRNSLGEVVAFNNDGQGTPDARLLDILIPADGIYTLEIGALDLQGDPHPADYDSLDPFFQAAYAGNDTGLYRLLVSTFLSANTTDGNNTIVGNGGNDTIEGGGQVQTGSLSGRVYHDVNNDGQFSDDEAGIAGVTLTLTDDQGISTQQITASDGSYSFSRLRPAATASPRLSPLLTSMAWIPPAPQAALPPMTRSAASCSTLAMRGRITTSASSCQRVSPGLSIWMQTMTVSRTRPSRR